MCTACPPGPNATVAAPPVTPLISLLARLCVDSQGAVAGRGAPTVQRCEGGPSQLWPVDPTPAPPNATLAQLQGNMSLYGYGAVRVRTDGPPGHPPPRTPPPGVACAHKLPHAPQSHWSPSSPNAPLLPPQQPAQLRDTYTGLCLSNATALSVKVNAIGNVALSLVNCTAAQRWNYTSSGQIVLQATQLSPSAFLFIFSLAPQRTPRALSSLSRCSASRPACARAPRANSRLGPACMTRSLPPRRSAHVPGRDGGDDVRPGPLGAEPLRRKCGAPPPPPRAGGG